MKESYFNKDKQFFKSLFSIMLVVAGQNLVNYSVNMADNLMLGAWGQSALSGAAVVNQIFFVVNAFVYNMGVAFSVLAAQYWGQRRTDKIAVLGGYLLKLNILMALVFFVISTLIPTQLVGIFTNDTEIIGQATEYLGIIKYTFIFYGISMAFIDMFRNVETVRIAFIVSVVSLAVNVILNYALIFGHFGAPALGVKGAAIATLIARVIEACIFVIYAIIFDKKLRFFTYNFFIWDGALAKSYGKVLAVILPTGLAWAIATPIQGALIGQMSADAIAANSVTSTFYQLLKVVAQAMGSGAGVVIGKLVGCGDYKNARSGARTIELIGLGIGLILGGLLFGLRGVIVSLYSLTPEAQRLTSNLIIIMSVAMVGMAYEIPVLFGTIRAGGDTKFTSIVNVGVLWCICMPLAFAGAFWWKLQPEWIIIFVQGEQLLKCIPAFIRVRQYDKWMKNMTVA